MVGCPRQAKKVSVGTIAAVWPRRESLEDLFLREIGRARTEERAS